MKDLINYQHISNQTEWAKTVGEINQRPLMVSYGVFSENRLGIQHYNVTLFSLNNLKQSQSVI